MSVALLLFGVILAPLRPVLEPYIHAANVVGGVLQAPDDARAWTELGAVLHHRSKTGAARLVLTRAAQLEPSDAALQLRLATLQRESGRHADARRTLAAAPRYAVGACRRLVGSTSWLKACTIACFTTARP